MSSKNPKDRIGKATWTLTEGIKDAVASNVTSAMKTSQVEIKPEQLVKLLSVINASIEEGYHRGSRVFNRVVDEALAQATLAAQEASPGPAVKKKTS